MTPESFRKLIAAATPGKFHDSYYKTLNEIPLEQQQKNMQLLMALRNRAEAFAELWEEARNLKTTFAGIETEQGFFRKMSDALAKLEAIE